MLQYKAVKILVEYTQYIAAVRSKFKNIKSQIFSARIFKGFVALFKNFSDKKSR